MMKQKTPTEIMKKIKIITKIADFLVKFCDLIMDVDPFACFDAMFFGKK